MNVFSQRRFLFWLMLTLIVLNVSALVSFYLFQTKEPQDSECCPGGQSCERSISSELGLTGEQSERVAVIIEKYKNEVKPLADSIRSLRSGMLAELETSDPDTLVLNGITHSMSVLQLEIQRRNIRQILDLKKVCTPDQAIRLSNLYRDLYGCPLKGEGMQRKHQHRNGGGHKGKDR